MSSLRKIIKKSINSLAVVLLLLSGLVEVSAQCNMSAPAASGPYQWYKDGIALPGANSAIYEAGNSAGNYFATYNGGTDSTLSFLRVCKSGFPNGAWLNSSATVGTYIWYKNGAIIPGATNVNYVANQTGVYHVEVTIGGGPCIAVSDSFNVCIVSCEICNDGIDNDGDGLIDCEDPDCALSDNCFTCTAKGTNGAGDVVWEAVEADSAYNRAVAFNFSGNDQHMIVPDGITSIKVKAWGAGGGSNNNVGSAGHGGAGGYTEAKLAVTPGEYLTIVVGQGGFGVNLGSALPDGYGLGGHGGTDPFGNDGQGGGLSGIFRMADSIKDTSLSRPLLIAGGGGGADGEGATPSSFIWRKWK